MLTGIELMLKRMESHPEEFVGVNGGCTRDWYAVVTPVIPYLTTKEKQLLTSALTQAYRDHFNTQTLRKIAGESIVDPSGPSRDFYQGESLIDKINGTSSTNTITSSGILGSKRLLASADTSVERYVPSAFGAVPGANGSTK